MPRPVNLLTPDAPDNARPDKQQRPPELGSAIRVNPLPAKKRTKEAKAPVDDLDKDIYTAEKGIPPMPDEGPTKNIKKYASGGSVSARADGCAQRGKTRGKMV
jgi:hypothetical protein